MTDVLVPEARGNVLGRDPVASEIPHSLVPGPTVATTPRSMTPRWVRWSLAALLVFTAGLYLYRLDISGYANSYYAAAAQAGSTSWKAFFYGSLDGGNLITVDKPPAALWFMALSVRIFGLSSWAILVPQALMGVATVALMYFAVRRWSGPVAGLLAAGALAATPVATLIFRFNNPDALLTLSVVAAAYAMIRAVEQASPRWIYLVGALIGLAFLTKLLQAFLVAPAFAVTYLVAAPVNLRTRITHLLRAAIATAVVAGSWLTTVALTPAATRPWIGSTTTNSIWDLTLGYNGLGRLTGQEIVGAKHLGGASGSVLRMLGSRMLVDVSWLFAIAIASVAVVLWITRHAARTDRIRASVLLWGTWLAICVVVFSAMSGIFHSYYSIEMAPAIAALFGIGATTLWRYRDRPAVLLVTVFTLGWTVTLAVAAFLLNRQFVPWLMWLTIVLGVGCIVGWAVPLLVQMPPRYTHLAPRTLAAASVVVCLAAPVSFSLATATSGRVGSSVSSGPNGQGRDLKNVFDCGPLASMLTNDSASYRWVAAATRVRIAEGCQLATGLPAMPIGGFNGSDGVPTLAQFVRFVSAGDVHYYLEYPGKLAQVQDPSVQIQAWVRTHFRGRFVDGVNVYNLSMPVR